MSCKISILSVVFVLVLLSCDNNPTAFQKDQAQKPSEEKSHFPSDHMTAKLFPHYTFDHNAYFARIDSIRDRGHLRNAVGIWEDQGPGNIGARVNIMAIDQNNDDIMYLGFARGGVYKTTDGGASWSSIFDEFTYLSVSDIRIDPNNSDIIYIGTGDENISHYPGVGNGIYRSMNGGDSWEHLGLGEESIISDIRLATDGSIYAGAMGLPFERSSDRGLYKSTDNGERWSQVLFIDDSTGIIDLEIPTDNPDLIYAAGWTRIRSNNFSRVAGPGSAIYRSRDGGENWDKLGSENGLPEGEFVRIGLDLFGNDGQTIFATYSADSENNTYCNSGGIGFVGLYKSTDGGDNWFRVSTEEDNNFDCDFQRGFAWYFGKLAVNPEDENDITVLGVTLQRTTDGGETWIDLTNFGPDDPHVDNHHLEYHNGRIYLGTDGGAYMLDEAISNSWQDIENISTNQFYRIAYNPHEPELYYGGLQDNGTVSGNQANINDWDRIIGGDGFQPQFNNENPLEFYAETQNGGIRRTEDGGNSFSTYTQGLTGDRNWNMPYFISPHDQNVLFTGTNIMYRRDNNVDEEWQPISGDLTNESQDSLQFHEHNMTTLGQSPINPDILYAGTSDGLAWATTNGGQTWNLISEELPRRYISDVKASPSFENTVYLSISGYKNNDFGAYIYRSDDNGETWTDISSNLVQMSINDIYILPNNDDKNLFVANEIGVYFSEDAGESWLRLGQDFPFIQCLDLEYNPENFQMVVGTYGRGLRTYDLSQLFDTSTENVANGKTFTINNPVASTIHLLQLDIQDEFGIQIYSIDGVLIEQTKNTTEISVEHFNPGLLLGILNDDC